MSWIERNVPGPDLCFFVHIRPNFFRKSSWICHLVQKLSPYIKMGFSMLTQKMFDTLRHDNSFWVPGPFFPLMVDAKVFSFRICNDVRFTVWIWNNI